MTHVAVVLSGCGFLDGAEITEAVSVLVHLSRAGATVDCFAPDQAQMHVVNHATGQPAPAETRNVMTEAARIARGKIKPLAALHQGDYDAVVFPGGYGAAKNLCDFATAGADCHADPQVERVIKAFHAAGKPVGACCIAPVLLARVLGGALGGPGVSVTIGNDPGAAKAIAAMGATHVEKPVEQAHLDPARRVATAPAYMYDAPPHLVYDGIGAMIDHVMTLCRARPGTNPHLR